MHYSLLDSYSRQYEDFVTTHYYGHLMQGFIWGEVKRHTGWTPYRMLLKKDGVIKAAISLLKLPWINSTCLLYAPRGPVLDFGDSAVLQALLDWIEKWAVKEKAVFLKIDPVCLSHERLAHANLLSAGFKQTANPISPGGFQPQVSYGVSWPYRNMGKLNLILEHGRRHKLKIEKPNCLDHVKVFYGLLLEYATNTNTNLRTLSYFSNLCEKYQQFNKGQLVLVRQGAALLAGAFIIGFGPRLYCLYAVGRGDLAKSYPLSFLHASMILFADKRGYRSYQVIDPLLANQKRPSDPTRPFSLDFQSITYLGEYDYVFSAKQYLLWKTLSPLYRWAFH